MTLRKSAGERTFDAFNVAFMLVLVLATAYPFYYILMASFSHPTLLAQARGFFLRPQGFSTAAYNYVASTPIIRTGYINTFIYMTAGTVVNLILTSLGA
jgi:putative aldouronate transport system permease protein